MKTEEVRTRGMSSGNWAAVLVVITLGALALVYVLLTGMAGAAGSYVRVDAPGHGTLNLPESGVYYVYHEYDRFEGLEEVTPPEEVRTLKVNILDQRTGQELELEPVEEEEVTYRIRRVRGIGFWRFFAPHPGEYELVSAYPTDSAAPPVTLAVGQTFANRIQTTLFAAAGVILITGLVLTGFLVYLRPDKAL